ncbi:zinc finger protein 263-like [Podarcis lilfordi]|uniref:Zinc finger protein 263-like n=2 Tax=Podarcis lilfordi TaxID=74358 RepID=A0AA35P9W8_9SAUR|nr:zinc finger protein 263-like [Podarcis lilfordi]
MTQPAVVNSDFSGEGEDRSRCFSSFQGAMDLAGMDVGAEIELTEDGSLDELPLHLENAKNCLSWETLDASSSDDDGEAYFTFYLPTRRPARPAQRLPAQRPPASPSARSAACAKWIPPLYPCPLRPSLPAAPGSPAFGAYQCQKCLQVFMEEWHYAQHLKDHAQEELQKPAAPPPRARSPPRKLRCLECGKRFLHPEHFARHTKWHLKLVRKGIKVCHRKGCRRTSSSSSSSTSPASQAAYVYKPAETQLGAKGASGLLAAQEAPGQLKRLQAPRAQKAGKRKSSKHQRKLPAASAPPTEGLLGPAHPGHSVAILDGDVGVALLQPWQKQEAILEGQVAGGLFQPAVMNADNQIIILDGDEAEVQATLFDGQGNVNALRPLFLRAEEQAAILDAPVSLSSLQLGGVNKDQAALAAGWVSQNPCTLLRTVLLQADEQGTVMDGQAETSPMQQVIIKTSEGASTLYLDPDPHLSSVDLATLHLVPLHQESQFITVPYGNALTLDSTDPACDGNGAWEEPQAATVQFSGYVPNPCQQNKQPSPPATASLSPKGSVVVRLVPGTSGGDHPEVLDLEYDMGGGIPVASEPWEANGRAGPEAYGAEVVAAAEEDFIVVEVDPDSRGPKMAAVSRPLSSHRRRASKRRRVRKPARRRRTAWGFRCPDCGARYSRVSQLRAHQKWPRRRGRGFLCECGTSFRGLLHLLRHQLQHLEEALFICAACGKSLKGHTGLARHGSCHPRPAHFSCPCGASFRRLSRYLWHHVRNQRPGLRVYTLSGFLPSS